MFRMCTYYSRIMPTLPADGVESPHCELILTAGVTLNYKGLCDEFNIHYDPHAGGGGFPRGLPWGTPCVTVRTRDTRETYYMYL